MDFITLTSVCNGFTVFITLTSVCNGFVFKYVCFHEIFSSTLPNHGIYTQIFSLIDFKLLYMNDIYHPGNELGIMYSTTWYLGT